MSSVGTVGKWDQACVVTKALERKYCMLGEEMLQC